MPVDPGHIANAPPGWHRHAFRLDGCGFARCRTCMGIPDSIVGRGERWLPDADREGDVRLAVWAAALAEEPRLGFYPHSIPGYIHARSLAGYFVPDAFAEQVRAQFRNMEKARA